MGRPFEVCARCVLDNREVPDITFDGKGVCCYCTRWIETERKRRVEATDRPWVYDRIRKEGRGKEYDVLLGLSGGVDSSTCLHHLVENGIRPLCWSMDNGYNDPKADENIMRLVEGMKVPFYRYVLDLDAFKDLQSKFIRSGTKNLEIPTDHVLMAAGYGMAREHGITTIISGGNHATEGIMPPSYGYDAKDLRFIEAVNGGPVKGVPTMSLTDYVKARFVDGIRTVNLLDYYDYDREASIRLLSERYGYRPYGEKHMENYFTAWFQGFYLHRKWGLDKRKPHYSSLINSGQITRSVALDSMTVGPMYPILGIEEKALSYPKRTYRDYPNSEAMWRILSKTYAVLKGGK